MKNDDKILWARQSRDTNGQVMLGLWRETRLPPAGSFQLMDFPGLLYLDKPIVGIPIVEMGVPNDDKARTAVAVEVNVFDFNSTRPDGDVSAKIEITLQSTARTPEPL